MATRAGQLRRRILLQRRSTAEDSVGAQSTAWVDVATVWAAIEPMSAMERYTAATVMTDVSHQITVRWQSFMADPKAVAAMRAVYNGRYFNIGGMANQEERNRVVVLYCNEGMNDG